MSYEVHLYFMMPRISFAADPGPVILYTLFLYLNKIPSAGSISWYFSIFARFFLKAMIFSGDRSYSPSLIEVTVPSRLARAFLAS